MCCRRTPRPEPNSAIALTILSAVAQAKGLDFNKLRVHDAGMPQAFSNRVAALVLIVVDSPDARALYGEYLEFCGFRVMTAMDGEQAVAAARSARPEVILMDLALPRIDGCQAIRQLRADPITADTPVVALSGQNFGDDPELAREAGADLCLTKPCLPSQVGRVVRAMLWRRELVRSTA